MQNIRRTDDESNLVSNLADCFSYLYFLKKESEKLKDLFKINWKIRFKNPVVWTLLIINLATTIFASTGLILTMDTTWKSVIKALISVFTKPYVFFVVISAIVGIIVDPTTHGFKDSDIALEYMEPKKSDTITLENASTETVIASKNVKPINSDSFNSSYGLTENNQSNLEKGDKKC